MHVNGRITQDLMLHFEVRPSWSGQIVTTKGSWQGPYTIHELFMLDILTYLGSRRRGWTSFRSCIRMMSVCRRTRLLGLDDVSECPRVLLAFANRPWTSQLTPNRVSYVLWRFITPLRWHCSFVFRLRQWSTVTTTPRVERDVELSGPLENFETPVLGWGSLRRKLQKQTKN